MQQHVDMSLDLIVQTGSDDVAKLLEASSAQLRKTVSVSDERLLSDTIRDNRLRSSSLDGTFLRGSHPVVNSMKEESSDESTIISSQTSTLTRSQGTFCL